MGISSISGNLQRKKVSINAVSNVSFIAYNFKFTQFEVSFNTLEKETSNKDQLCRNPCLRICSLVSFDNLLYRENIVICYEPRLVTLEYAITEGQNTNFLQSFNEVSIFNYHLSIFKRQAF